MAPRLLGLFTASFAHLHSDAIAQTTPFNKASIKPNVNIAQWLLPEIRSPFVTNWGLLLVAPIAKKMGRAERMGAISMVYLDGKTD